MALPLRMVIITMEAGFTVKMQVRLFAIAVLSDAQQHIGVVEFFAIPDLLL